ncbi:MAG: hypothetical protein ACJ72N_23475 [Labedaea sp.]
MTVPGDCDEPIETAFGTNGGRPWFGLSAAAAGNVAMKTKLVSTDLDGAHRVAHWPVQKRCG